MTIAIVVIISEASGDVSMVIPLMVSVLIGGYVAGFLSEPYDEKMTELRLIPFLRDSQTHETDRRLETAANVMIASPTISELEPLARLKSLVESASNSDYMALPVVSREGHLLGLVSGEGVKKVLAQCSIEVFSNGDRGAMLTDIADWTGVGEKKADEAVLLSMTDVMDPSPYTVLADFPLSRLYPIFSKLKIENAVVQDHSGKPVGVVHRTCLIDGNLDYSDNSDFAKVNKLQYRRTSQEGVGRGGKGREGRGTRR